MWIIVIKMEKECDQGRMFGPSDPERRAETLTDKKQLAFLPGKNIVARTTTVVSLTKVCIYSLLGVVLAPAV